VPEKLAIAIGIADLKEVEFLGGCYKKIPIPKWSPKNEKNELEAKFGG